MTLCDHCGGTFFPESLEEVVRYRSLRYETMQRPEAWHMTDGLRESLAAFVPASGPLLDVTSTTVLLGLPRCEHENRASRPHEIKRLLSNDHREPPYRASSTRDGVADAEHVC